MRGMILGVLGGLAACGDDGAGSTDGGSDGSDADAPAIDAMPDACAPQITISIAFSLAGNGGGTSPLDSAVGRAQTLVATLHGWTELYSSSGNNITAAVPTALSLDFEGMDGALFDAQFMGATPGGPLGGAFDETIFVGPTSSTRATLDVDRPQLNFNSHCFNVALTTNSQGHVALAPFSGMPADCNVQILDQRTGSRFFSTPAGVTMSVAIERCMP